MTAHARNTDPETSHEAAASVANLTEVKRNILLILEGSSEPMMDWEIVRKYYEYTTVHNWAWAMEQSIRSRRADLVRDGKIEFANDWGQSVTGRRSRKWRLTPRVSKMLH